MPPPTTPCPSCGRAFFPSSLRIHLPQCKAKQAAVVVECPACGIEVPNSQLNAHMAKCPAASSRSVASRTGNPARRAVPSRGPGPSKPPLPYMAIAPTEADGRVPCAKCGRKFSPDRIAKHQFACMRQKKRPAPRAPAAAASSRQTPRDNAASLAAASGGTGSRWRAQSQQLRAALRAARGGGQPRALPRGACLGGDAGGGPEPPSLEKPCPHCARTFAERAWSRHVALCQSIRARPDPPPGARDRAALPRPAPSSASGTLREVRRSASGGALAPATRGGGDASRGAAAGRGGRARGAPGGAGMGMGAGAGGILPSNETSRDNPLSSMLSYRR